MKKDTIQIVKDILREQLAADDIHVTDFLEDLGADSLDTVEIIMAVEERFGIDITDDELPDIKTVTDLVKCIEAKQ